MAVDQPPNSNNELAILDDVAQPEYIPALCAPVEDNSCMDIAEDTVEAVESNAMKEMRGMVLLLHSII